MEAFTIEYTFVVSPSRIYNDLLGSKTHSAMTGGQAEISDEEGAHFTAWDGYIEGKNLELKANQFIKQAWRTSEFDNSDEDSILEITLSESEQGGCLLSMSHSNIPDGQGDSYKRGWYDHYFHPMEEYYNTSG